MTKRIKINRWANTLSKVVCCILMINITGCKPEVKIEKIGIAANHPVDTELIQGFKSGMEGYGHIEGQQIKYIYTHIPEMTDQTIDRKIKELLDQNIDLLLTIEKEASIRAAVLTKSTDVPVLFTAHREPVKDGLVDKLSHPGGNVTGVQFYNTISKALELLTMIIPDGQKIYIPYDPDDRISTAIIPELHDTADKLGIELVLDEIHSVEQAVDAILNLPKDFDAIYRIASLTLNERNEELSHAAIKRRIPMAASIDLDEDVLMTFSNDFFSAGKQAARLAHQILQGLAPMDLPVETGEVRLTINLKTAEKIGIQIPMNILAQANSIIR